MDPIADLLTRIRNAQQSGHETVEAPFSRIKFEIAKILEQQGFLGGVEKKGAKGKEKLELKLKYDQGAPAIQELRRISKTSQRKYIGARNIRLVRQGYGTAVVSTSAGLMTDREAKKKSLGGEVLLEVW